MSDEQWERYISQDEPIYDAFGDEIPIELLKEIRED